MGTFILRVGYRFRALRALRVTVRTPFLTVAILDDYHFYSDGILPIGEKFTVVDIALPEVLCEVDRQHELAESMVPLSRRYHSWLGRLFDRRTNFDILVPFPTIRDDCERVADGESTTR